MEFLKELFGDGQALTYGQLAEAVQTRGMQVVDAAGGAYVPKEQVDALTGRLGEVNRKLEGYDPTWKEKAEAARRDLEAQQFNFALERALLEAKPRHVQAVLPFLDREKLTLAGGEVLGLDKQVEALKKRADTAFLFEESQPMRTGMSHQNAHEVGGGDKKEAANEALRGLFGSAE